MSFPAPQTAGRSKGETQQELGLILLPEQCKHFFRSYRRPVKAGRPRVLSGKAESPDMRGCL